MQSLQSLMRTLTVSLLPLVALVTTGCDPILSVHGNVRSAPDACGPNGDGGPISITPPIQNAKMTLKCGDHVVLEAMSDDKGKFGNGTAGFGSASCIVRVEKDGFIARDFKLMDYCSGENGKPEPRKDSGPCIAHINVELEPSRVGAPPIAAPPPKP